MDLRNYYDQSIQPSLYAAPGPTVMAAKATKGAKAPPPPPDEPPAEG